MSANINKDLVREREKCTFDRQELIHIIDGGEEKTLMRKRVENLVLSVKDLNDEIPEDYLSHKEKYENGIRKGCIMFDVYLQLTGDNPHKEDRSPSNIYRIHEGVLKQVNPFLLHFGLFVPTIMNQANSEQQAEWLKKGSKMIGTYSQTELGHGTFLRGLETTATFDPETDEFILNSPTLTAYKFWPGGLGHTCNASIVMAQLHINGKSLGIHLFLVQIRDFETHEPLPGIKVGEIGPKLGFNTANNGFLGFNNCRIPRKNMLMKNAQVLRDGTYIKSKNDKLTYGSMVLIRVHILTDVAYELARAVTIAIRYSAVRHQSLLKNGEPEAQVLDYVTQQHKLFISIASSHAFRVMGQWLWKTYTKVMAEIAEGNMDQLPELHALSCCLKAVCSYDGVQAVERCRLACGGHGYLLSSNLPGVYGLVAASVTYEGEYTVLLLQTARYLVKAWNGAINGKTLPSGIAFLSDYFNKNSRMWDDSPEAIIEGFKAVAAGKIKAAFDSLQSHVDKGREFEDAWNLSSVQLTAASEAYARYLLCDVFWSETKKMTNVSNNLAVVLLQLAELYLVYWALEKSGDLLMVRLIFESLSRLCMIERKTYINIINMPFNVKLAYTSPESG
ncbi:probable peroxisomal acyl-coenzyme A oxidase 1 isoform X2 [Nymphalis io]|uniref:probable peroxisomal acyl-coenzyme A oxidase 1 isoform X2 n=1 Tax=Inachis io TaxID=171585 RepID=UPI00216A862E|nr:probable peroxisomal acyl-coenzyme A oxidase 1 isoform X2 [Nymphalis io]